MQASALYLAVAICEECGDDGMDEATRSPYGSGL